MPPMGFEPAIPATEWPQTHALESAATGIGSYANYLFSWIRTGVLELGYNKLRNLCVHCGGHDVGLTDGQ
jgi:hypothetical protein